jgi:hypothetical protein
MRRIKYFAGQHETQPIKDKREIDALYIILLKENYKRNLILKSIKPIEIICLFILGLIQLLEQKIYYS